LLFGRIHGKSDGSVKKSQFLEFVVGLTHNVASDRSCWDLEVGEGRSTLSETSGRRRPPLCQQFLLLLQRGLLRWQRQTVIAAVTAVLMIITAVVFGLLGRNKIHVKNWETPARLMANMMGLGLLTAISGLNVFGPDRQVFWRESASGISVVAFYCSRVVISFVDVQVQCIIYTVTWWLVAQPDAGFWLSYQAFRMLAFSVTAWGYVMSAILAPQNTTLGVAVIILLLGAGLSDPIAIATDPSNMQLLSPFTWSYGTQYLRVVDFGGGAASMDLAGQHFETAFRGLIPQTRFGYSVTMQVVLISWGIVLHVAGYVALKYSHRNMQV